MMKMRTLAAAGMMVISLMTGASNVMACIECDYFGGMYAPEYTYSDYDFYYNDSDYGVDPAYYNSYDYSSYVLPYSDSMYYTSADLACLSNVDLLIARNEIYARHGRLFNDQSIQRYFDAQSWYYGYVSANSFSESVFNDCEQANVDLIVAEERARGSQVTTLAGIY